jgi:hypothetical protein
LIIGKKPTKKILKNHCVGSVVVCSSDVRVWWLESYTLEPIFEIYFTSPVYNKGSDYKPKNSRAMLVKGRYVFPWGMLNNTDNAICTKYGVVYD